MERISAEGERKQALISAAIDLIGEHGSLDVPVKEIARQAGMSPALAFHYFGDKEQIVTETMRHLMRQLGRAVSGGLKRADTPNERLDAIIAASFAPNQFDRPTIAAWLVFYLHAFSSSEAARLLAVYTGRLRSNLVHTLQQITGDREKSLRIADTLGALIDGIYIRQALNPGGPDHDHAVALCQAYLEDALGERA